METLASLPGYSLQLLVDPPDEPQANMARDVELAQKTFRAAERTVLRVYRWNQPCVSIGSRQKPDELPPDWVKRKLPVVRRPTGGGAVLHRLDELTYALAIPRGLLPKGRLGAMAALFHQFVLEALLEKKVVEPGRIETMGSVPPGPATLCFSSPVCGDLIYQGRKVIGSAMRVWREGILLQGTIQELPVPKAVLTDALFRAAQKLSAIQSATRRGGLAKYCGERGGSAMPCGGGAGAEAGS